MAVQVDNLTVAADGQADKTLLRDISFTAEDRAVTLIVGRSGSGKSTLLRTLAGLVQPGSGNVYYNGRPLWHRNRPDRTLLLQTSLAFQFPEHQLFAGTAQGEFDYSLRPYKLPKAERLRRTVASLEEQRLPESMLAHPPLLLSGGQKRRLALATIMAPRTPWVLLDEPSAGLDSASLSRLTAELAQWKRRCGIVLATHDLDAFLPIADRVLILRDGEVAAIVTPDQLAANPQPLLTSGVGLPEAMRVAAALRRAGIPAPGFCPPARMAEAIAACTEASPTPPGDAAAAIAPAGAPARAERAYAAAPEPARSSLLYRAKASRKWLAYTLVSVGIILQTGWLGIAAALLFVLGCMSALTADDRRTLLRLCKPLVWFIAFAVGFSGILFELPPGFSIPTALETFRRLFAFLEITALGLMFTLSTSTADMKAGLEHMLRPLKRIGAPVEVIALSASLVLRFIPLILEEAERFAAIARARGKRSTKPGQVHMRDIPVFVIPLLTALLQAVEELIFAMDLKGVMQPHQPRTAGQSVQERADNPAGDRRIVQAGVVMLLLLMVIRVMEVAVL